MEVQNRSPIPKRRDRITAGIGARQIIVCGIKKSTKGSCDSCYNRQFIIDRFQFSGAGIGPIRITQLPQGQGIDGGYPW
jgi:hypothetical protein